MKRSILNSRIKSANVKLFPEVFFGYLGGPILALISNAIINVYLIQYWDIILKLNEWAYLFVTLLPIISSIFVVTGNLLIGKLMERKQTKYGKARPLLILSVPLIALSLIALFLVPFPSGATADTATKYLPTLIMVALGYNLYYAIAYPLYYSSHSALVNLSTRDESKRTLIATASNGALMGAAGLASMIGPFFIGILGLLPTESNYKKMYPLATSLEDARSQANYKWTILMIIIIVALVVGVIIEFLFTRERITEECQIKGEKEESKLKTASIKEQINICVKDKYWWFIMIFFFLYQLGGALKNNSSIYFSRDFIGDESLSGLINIVGAIPTALGMVAIWPIANKFGKAKSIKYGCLLVQLFGLIGFLCLLPGVRENVALVSTFSISGFALKSLGTVPAMYVSLALLSDVLDHQEALHKVRTDGFSIAVYGSIMIAMNGLANGIIIGIHGSIDPTKIEMLQNAITFLFFGGEMVCYLIIYFIFNFMNVEDFSKLVKLEIIKNQKETAEKEGREFVEPEKKLLLEQQENEKISFENTLKEIEEKCTKSGIDPNKMKDFYIKEYNSKKEFNEAKKKLKDDLSKINKERKELIEETRKSKLTKEQLDALK